MAPYSGTFYRLLIYSFLLLPLLLIPSGPRLFSSFIFFYLSCLSYFLCVWFFPPCSSSLYVFLTITLPYISFCPGCCYYVLRPRAERRNGALALPCSRSSTLPWPFLDNFSPRRVDSLLYLSPSPPPAPFLHSPSLFVAFNRSLIIRPSPCFVPSPSHVSLFPSLTLARNGLSI
jgi:hypothetical protein